MLNLLHRYGDRNGLRFALPARYQFGYPRLFQASWVKGYRPQGGGTKPPFHILCHHMRFNLKEVRGIGGGGWDWREMVSGLWPRPPWEEATGLGIPRQKLVLTQKLGTGVTVIPIPLSSAASCLVVSGSQSPAFSHLELPGLFPWPVYPIGISALTTLTP